MSHGFNRGGKPSGPGSQFDSQQTLKLGFDDNLQSFRFHDSESPIYDRFDVETDVLGNITKIVYYVADTHEKLELGTTADIGGSMNNQYFVLASAYDRLQFYVWYNVDGTGVDPQPIAGATGIEVGIQAGDPETIVALATKMALSLNQELVYIYDISLQSAVLTLKAKKEGPITTNSIGTTSFILNVLEEGTEVINEIYSFTYDGDCNITGMFKL